MELAVPNLLRRSWWKHPWLKKAVGLIERAESEEQQFCDQVRFTYFFLRRRELIKPREGEGDETFVGKCLLAEGGRI